MDTQARMTEMRAYLLEIAEYRRVNGLLFWDSMQPVPKAGSAGRARTRAFMAKKQFELECGPQMGAFLQDLLPYKEQMGDFDRALLRVSAHHYNQNAGLPKELFEQYEACKARAMDCWDQAYKAGSYAQLAPSLQQVFQTQKEVCRYYPSSGSAYNQLIRLYEEDMDTATLDRLFSRLKEALVPLVQAIAAKKRPRPAFLDKKVPISVQQELCRRVCRHLDIDESRAMLYQSTHPFSFLLNVGDVRFTTRYREDDFFSSIASTLHEGGHSLYSLHIPEHLVETVLGEGASPAFHESQSRFYENIIGRSRGFLSLLYPDIIELAGPYLGPLTLEELVQGVNYVSPSLIRTDADELTYSLHIILRYELEKEMIDGDMDFSQLPTKWNQKTQEYFGLVPQEDKTGVLQDIQWPAGRIGAFCAYALGNVYGAQILHTLKQQLPLEELISKGRIAQVNQWLAENVHRYSGLYPPRQQLQKITGEDLNPDFYISYLTNKYAQLYDL